MATTELKPVIIGFLLQSKPYVLVDGEGDVLGFTQFSDAVAHLREIQPKHLALKAADSIIITDLDTGESDVYL